MLRNPSGRTQDRSHSVIILSFTTVPFDNWRYVRVPGRVCDGVLVRANRESLTPDRVSALQSPTAVVDLRTPVEIADRPLPSSVREKVRYVAISLPWTEWEEPPRRGERRDLAVAQYCAMVKDRDGRLAIGKALRIMADPTLVSTVVCCEGGRDRTGLVIAVALHLIGVGPESIARDYALTERAWLDWLLRSRASAGLVASQSQIPAALDIRANAVWGLYSRQGSAPMSVMVDFVNWLTMEFQTTLQLVEWLGLDHSDLEALSMRLDAGNGRC